MNPIIDPSKLTGQPCTKGKNCELETNVAIRVMSMSIKKEQDQKGKFKLQTTQILTYFNIIIPVILYLTV